MAIELRVPSDPRLLQIIRSWVGHIAALFGFSEKEAQGVVLAVDEACANIIRHAYGGRKDGEILISCTESEHGIEFLLRDCGSPAEPSCWQGRPLDEIRPGGLGVPLIRAVMDRVEYRRVGQVNELLLVKKLTPPA
jgi:anti-sigma regulatory factor (Ser/Thr protein kinase)